MKNSVICSLAVVAMSVGAIGAQASAEELNAMSRAANASRELASPGPMTWDGASPAVSSALAASMGQRSMQSSADAPLDSSSSLTLVIASSSLVASDAQQMSVSPGGELTGSGFAPIKAGMAARAETGDQLTRSADVATLRNLYTPQN